MVAASCEMVALGSIRPVFQGLCDTPETQMLTVLSRVYTRQLPERTDSPQPYPVRRFGVSISILHIAGQSGSPRTPRRVFRDKWLLLVSPNLINRHPLFALRKYTSSCIIRIAAGWERHNCTRLHQHRRQKLGVFLAPIFTILVEAC
jgi:hypothetical protein